MTRYSNYFLNDKISSVTNDRNAFEGLLKLGYLYVLFQFWGGKALKALVLYFREH